MHYRGKFSLELIRKTIHVLTGIFIVIAFQAGILTLGILGILILMIAALIAYNFKAEKELLTHILAINRADAKVPGLSILAYLLGCWIVLALFEPKIAYASILILAFGDAMAHIISRSFGGTQTIITKTTYVEGTVAGIVAGTIVAWIYVALIPAIVASSAAMLVEAGELRIGSHHVDDNLTIPIVAGVTLWIISLIFPF